MSQELIENIIGMLEELGSTEDPDMASVFASALSSARASASRALIPNTRVGSLARYSVAASASSPLRAYLASTTRSPGRDELMRGLLYSAFKLADGIPPRKPDEAPETIAPEGWDAKSNGFFTLHTPLGVAEILYSPHMPGGDWTLNLGRIPVGFASTPSDNAILLAKVLSFLANDRPAARRIVNPFRTARSA